jgi:hypothetical protein
MEWTAIASPSRANLEACPRCDDTTARAAAGTGTRKFAGAEKFAELQRQWTRVEPSVGRFWGGLLPRYGGDDGDDDDDGGGGGGGGGGDGGGNDEKGPTESLLGGASTPCPPDISIEDLVQGYLRLKSREEVALEDLETTSVDQTRRECEAEFLDTRI